MKSDGIWSSKGLTPDSIQLLLVAPATFMLKMRAENEVNNQVLFVAFHPYGGLVGEVWNLDNSVVPPWEEAFPSSLESRTDLSSRSKLSKPSGALHQPSRRRVVEAFEALEDSSRTAPPLERPNTAFRLDLLRL